MRDMPGGTAGQDASQENDIPGSETLGDLPGRHDIEQPARRWTFASPAPVYDADGRQVGTLNLGSPRDYLVVQRPGERDLYIPLGAVNRSDASGVYLSLSQADLSDRRWLAPPAPYDQSPAG